MSLKDATRKALLAQRGQAHKAEAPGNLIAMRTWLQSLLSPGFILGVYQPIRTERDPAPLLEALDCILSFPRVQGPGTPLRFYQTQGPKDFEAGSFGVMEPLTSLPLVIPHVILVPLVGFDAAGYRLGYGGGFYDRTLADIRAQQPVQALGFAYDGQLSEQPLNFEATDARLDAVLTPTRRYDFTAPTPEIIPWS